MLKLARVLIVAVFLASSLLSPAASAPRHHHHHTAAAAQSASAIQYFDTEAGAQRHCPADTVVWLNTNTGIYHLQGERWYGRTKAGAFVCKREADAAGDRETLNGQ